MSSTQGTSSPTAAPGTAPRRRQIGRGATSVVLVCLANRCRSPLAEHLLRRRLIARGLDVDVSSMGFLAAGLPTPEIGVKVAADHGIDLSRHLSRGLDHRHLLEADLILTMERVHARDLVAEIPEVWPRVHTLKQFVALVSSNPIPRHMDFSSWVYASGESRQRQVLLGDLPADDVADPMGRSARFWRKTFTELDDLTHRMVDGSAGVLPAKESAE